MTSNITLYQQIQNKNFTDESLYKLLQLTPLRFYDFYNYNYDYVYELVAPQDMTDEQLSQYKNLRKLDCRNNNKITNDGICSLKHLESLMYYDDRYQKN